MSHGAVVVLAPRVGAHDVPPWPRVGVDDVPPLPPPSQTGCRRSNDEDRVQCRRAPAEGTESEGKTISCFRVCLQAPTVSCAPYRLLFRDLASFAWSISQALVDDTRGWLIETTTSTRSSRWARRVTCR